MSHYLLARALDSVALTEADLNGVINTSDVDMTTAYVTNDVEVVVIWNSLVSAIVEEPSANKLFDSADIPGEIIDLMVVNTNMLAANPDFGKALASALYEVIGLMAAGDEEVLTAMTEASGTDLAGYKAQLASTEILYDLTDAVAFTQGVDLPITMTNIAEFLFDKGIPGEEASSADFVGVEYPNGTITCDANNVTFRFDTTFMQMVADDAL
ncbi:hypothetical protein [Parasulfitobacter algicola]|uniref:hypothetical protein n=1 Tax=Parasulfitobacter algicola TaxID=2614809 RepID=UPI001FE45592|nr:hypothetical protein [Sulfitobacter algicola]